ncbi:MAG: chorismate synthase [Armatimonadota bacterium]|jgi:chorismate synthase
MLGDTFGRMFRVTTCGESYGGALLIIVDGVPAGLDLCDDDVQADLDRRRPGTKEIDSPRLETDQVKVVAGVMDGKTTGAPVGMAIYNVDTQPIHVQQYREVKDLMRPGHAEYGYFVKYGEFTDWRGAGRASGRETAGRVSAGAVAKKILAREGIEVVGYVKEAAGIKSREMSFEDIKANREKNDIRCPDLEAGEKMLKKILEIKEAGDTAGGIVEVIARGVPAGLGEPVFDKLDADIAKAFVSIGSVKGVEIGTGFAAAEMVGSEHNDIPYMDGGNVKFRTNNAGGILGGISNGDDIVARMVVKPTCTISIDQQTINMPKMQEATLAAITRRDATICGRVVPVGEAMMAIVLVDHLMMSRGLDAVAKLDKTWPRPEGDGE